MPMKKTTTAKKSVTKENNKKVDLKRWEDYQYWSNLGDKKRDEIMDRMCEKYGMDFMAKKISTRKLNLYLEPADFTITEVTPLGTITAALYDEFSACRRKDGGFIYRTGLSVVSPDEKDVSTEAHYHFEGFDSVMCEVVETMCDKLAELVRGAFYNLYNRQHKGK